MESVGGGLLAWSLNEVWQIGLGASRMEELFVAFVVWLLRMCLRIRMYDC